MRDFFSTIHPRTFPLLTLAIGLPAAYFGSLWGWTPGAASLALLSVPTCAAALSGDRIAAYASALIAGAVCLGELAVSGPGVDGELSFVFPVMAAIVFLGFAAIICAPVAFLRRRMQQLEEQNTEHVRTLYQRNKDSEAGNTDDKLATDKRSSSTEDVQAVNYPLLMLTLQEIGRRISTNLDLDTLVPTIIATAKASLKCADCQVYFWNSREQSLQNVLQPRKRDRNGYIPRPQTGMTKWVLDHRQILTRKTVEEDYSLRQILADDPDLPDAIAPLAVGGELLGLLVVDGVEHDSPTFVRMLYILANDYALGIKNAQLFERIEEMAKRDGLTGLLNHASFQQECQTMVEAASANSQPLSIIMSDVDHFKKFNDTYGHQAGDEVLRAVSRLWQAVIPDHAVLARYGGEEFICALPHDDLQAARDLAELLREQVDSNVVDFEGQQLHVTASFGVAVFGPKARSAQEIIRLADEALYEAKEAGRNQVVCSKSTPTASEQQAKI